MGVVMDDVLNRFRYKHNIPISVQQQRTIPRMATENNPILAENASLLMGDKAIGVLRAQMKAAGFEIGQGTLSRIRSGETGVRMESLQKFADYHRVDLDTLLRGHINSEDEFVPVSRLSVEVGAGPGRIVGVIEQIGMLQFRRDFLRSMGVSPVNAAIVTARGTSMEPTISDGAVLLVNRSDQEPRAGSIYAFSWGEEMLVKRFQKVAGVWHAVSDNADKDVHPDIVLDGAAHAVIQGRAIWMGARL